MDPRTFSQRRLPWLVRGLDEFNARHPWSHNDHFHPWILRRLRGAGIVRSPVGTGRSCAQQ